MRFLIAFFLAQLILSPISGLLHAAESKHTEDADVSYQCSMHPWIVSNKPENCPVCGMKLTKIKSGTSQGEVKKGRATVEISPERQQMIGVTKEKAIVRPLVYSVHSVGHVAYNPDIATTLGEYREAYAAYRKTRGTPAVRDNAMKLMELAELKLRLSGMGSEQVEQVKNSSFNTTILSDSFAPVGVTLPEGSVWVDTDLYESDSELVKPGDEVSMAAAALPGQIFNGTVRVVDPILNEFPRKLRVRIETKHADTLKAGMAVDVRIMVSLGEKLSIPETSLIDSGHTQLVFVDQGNGNIEPREIRVGSQADDYYEVMEGLHAGETVITSAAFLIDSESKLKAAAQGFSKNQNKETAPASGHVH